eukprot:6053379-Prymnesium_polylepis.1
MSTSTASERTATLASGASARGNGRAAGVACPKTGVMAAVVLAAATVGASRSADAPARRPSWSCRG